MLNQDNLQNVPTLNWTFAHVYSCQHFVLQLWIINLQRVSRRSAGIFLLSCNMLTHTMPRKSSDRRAGCANPFPKSPVTVLKAHSISIRKWSRYVAMEACNKFTIQRCIINVDSDSEISARCLVGELTCQSASWLFGEWLVMLIVGDLAFNDFACWRLSASWNVGELSRYQFSNSWSLNTFPSSRLVNMPNLLELHQKIWALIKGGIVWVPTHVLDMYFWHYLTLIARG